MYAKNNGLGEWDIASIIGDVAKVWGSVEQAKAAAKVAKYQTQAQTQRDAILYQQNTQYPATLNTGANSSTLTTVALIGGAVFLMYLLMRKD